MVVLFAARIVLAEEKKPEAGALTGTLESVSHGGGQGEIPFTLILEQKDEEVTGSDSSDMGSAEITSGSFKDQILESKVVTHQFTNAMTGKLEIDKPAGEGTFGEIRSGNLGREENRSPDPVFLRILKAAQSSFLVSRSQGSSCASRPSGSILPTRPGIRADILDPEIPS